jgi:hypothetical protein
MSDQLVADAAAYATHDKQNRTFMASAEFEPVIPAIEPLQTYALDRTAAGIGQYFGFEVGIPPSLTIRVINAKLTRVPHYGEMYVRI